MSASVEAVSRLRAHDPALADLVDAYVAKLQAGAPVDPETFARAHPEHEERLRKLLPALHALAALGSAAGSGQVSARPAEREPLGTLGDYRIVREIGSGGMGVVYEAEQISLNRRVALKVLPALALARPTQKERFGREAQVAARLHHTNIVPVFGVGEDRGVLYYAMQFIRGQGLDAVLRDVRRLRERREEVVQESVAHSLATGRFEVGPEAADVPLTPESRPDSSSALSGSHPDSEYFRGVARLGAQAADALAYAHGQGVLHRDVKPSNLLLDIRGTLWLTDFGLAKAEGSDALTDSGDIVGTLRYLAPECLRGPAGVASEVYGLGATLYELLTLRPAFADDDRARLVERIAREEPPRPRQVDVRIPRDLETVVLKAMAKEPGRRYATMAELAEDLRRFLAGRPIRARRVGPAERLWRWGRRNPALAASAVAVVLSLLAGTGVSLSYAVRADAEAARAIEQRDAARWNLYVADMNLAQVAWAEGNGARTLALLEGQRPPRGDRDLRGWEWHHQWRQCHLELRTLTGHTDSVYSVAYSPDGRQLATSSKDRTVRIWDAATGQVLHTLEGHTSAVWSVAFSPDGTRLASATSKGSSAAESARPGEIVIWDATSGKRLDTFQSRSGGIWRVAFSPNGRRLAAACFDQAIAIWDVATCEVVQTLKGHTGIVWDVAYSPDGKLLASAGGDDRVIVWDAADGRNVRSLSIDDNLVRSVAFSPDGTRLAAASVSGAVKIWDTARWEKVRTLHGTEGHRTRVSHLAFSPDGTRLASASWDQTVKVWDLAGDQPPRTLKGHTFYVGGVAFSPDGTRLASASSDKTVKVWDLAGSREPRAFKGHSVALSPDGTRLAVRRASSEKPNEVLLWDVGSGQLRHTLRGHAQAIFTLTFSPDGTRLASSDGGGILKIWDVASGIELRTLSGHAGRLYDVAFRPGGEQVASGGQDGIRIWDTATGRELHFFPDPREITRRLAFHPDGAYLASGGEDYTVKVWDVASGHLWYTFAPATAEDRGPEPRPFHSPSWVDSALFSPDGARLLAVSYDGMVREWDFASGRELRAFQGPLRDSSSVAFSPDRTRLVTYGAEVKFWDPVSGQELRTLKGHTGTVHGVSFSADGWRLASGDSHGTVLVWDATPRTPGRDP